MSYTTFFPTTFNLLVRPFTNRIKLGEGGLLILNFTHSVASSKPYALIILETVISFWVLCVLYGYNDYTDVEKDKFNPKKDPDFIKLVSDNYTLFLNLIIAVQFLTISVAFIFLSWHTALYMVVLYAINFLYSHKVKSIPLADIVIVSFWGGLYICLSGYFRWEISLAAGLMVGIAHFFQVITDKDSDQKNSVSTSAVVLIGWENLLLFILCMALAFVVYLITNDVILAAIGFLPFMFYFLSKRVTLSWYMSRFLFFILWLLILKKVYAGI